MLRALALAALSLQCAVLAIPLEDTITPRRGESCGYESCPTLDQNVLNVHLVAHTHDDVGWLKTVDQYYYGSRNNIQKAGVQYIIDSVVRSLLEDPKRRFVYVETAFFWKWWTQQSKLMQGMVHELVRQGRLEFIGGAWSMNDEASTHYQSTIDQFTFGLRKLNDTFGQCARPRVGWQIDPFGHAREFASLLAGMDYDAVFLGRIDYQDKGTRLGAKAMETLWRGDDNVGKPSDIFTGVLYNHYSPPSGFCFDVLCSDEPIIDDRDSPMYNVDKRIGDFLEMMSQRSEAFRHKHLLVTMGDDFHYQDAGMWFKNIDKLIKYGNLKSAKEGLNINLLYSTPSCYLKAVQEANPTLPTKQDDFFPYASDSTAYWTGYFSSRPTTKFFERQGNGYLQATKQLQVLANLEDHNSFVLHELSAVMGVMQHHDAITGTEKQHVTSDYERMLTEAIEDALTVSRQAFNKVSQGDALKTPLLSYDWCQFNQSQCATSEDSSKFVLTVYNPLGWEVTAPIRVPIVDQHYTVTGPDGKEIPVQITKLSPLVLNIPTRSSKATHELVFVADGLPALGFKQYYVARHDRMRRDVDRSKDLYSDLNGYWKNIRQRTYVDIRSLENADEKMPRSEIEAGAPKMIPDEPVRVVSKSVQFGDVDLESELQVLRGVQSEMGAVRLEEYYREARAKLGRDGDSRDLKERFQFPVLTEHEMRMLSDDPAVVKASEDTLENEHYTLKIDENSGDITHVSLPDGSEYRLSCSLVMYKGCVGDNRSPDQRSSGAYIFRPNGTKSEEVTKAGPAKVTRGAVFDQVEYEFEHGTLAVTLYKHPKLEDIELSWTVSIDVSDGVGKEIAVLYETDLINNGEFYTDSNGRQMIKRKLNQRPQYNVTLVEPVPGNYYPVTNKISIHDEKRRFAVITDRAHGGSSLQEGQIELMVHRRLLHDDAFGVEEPLNETALGKPLVARGSQYLFLKPLSNENMVKEKVYTFGHHLPPQVFVSNAESLDYDAWFKLKNVYSGLRSSLPEGLHLLTLEPWKGDTLLLRLENYYEKTDKDDTNVEVDVSSLFTGLRVVGCEETNLAANQWSKDSRKWDWKTESEFSTSFNEEYGSSSPVARAEDASGGTKELVDFKVTLAAREIRTFVVEYRFDSEL